MNDILTNALGGIISGTVLWIIGFAVTYCKNKHWTKENTLKAITEDKQVRDQIIEMTRSFADRKIFIIGDNQQGRNIDTQALIAYAPDFNLITHENGFEKAEIPIINGTMNATMNNAQGRLQSDIYALLQTIPSDTPSSTKNS